MPQNLTRTAARRISRRRMRPEELESFLDSGIIQLPEEDSVAPETAPQDEPTVLDVILPKNQDIPPVNFALVLFLSISQIFSNVFQIATYESRIYGLLLLLPLLLLLRISVTLERRARRFLPPFKDPYAHGLGRHVLAGIYLSLLAVTVWDSLTHNPFDPLILVCQAYLLVPDLWPWFLGGPLKLDPWMAAFFGLVYLSPKPTPTENAVRSFRIMVSVAGFAALGGLFSELNFENWGSAMRTNRKRVSFVDNREVMGARDGEEDDGGLYRRPSVFWFGPHRARDDAGRIIYTEKVLRSAQNGPTLRNPRREWSTSLIMTTYELYAHFKETALETLYFWWMVHKRFIYLQLMIAPFCWWIGGCVRFRSFPPFAFLGDLLGFTYRWDESFEVAYKNLNWYGALFKYTVWYGLAIVLNALGLGVPEEVENLPTAPLTSPPI